MANDTPGPATREILLLCAEELERLAGVAQHVEEGNPPHDEPTYYGARAAGFPVGARLLRELAGAPIGAIGELIEEEGPWADDPIAQLKRAFARGLLGETFVDLGETGGKP